MMVLRIALFFYDNHDKCIFSCVINSNTSLVVSDYFYICDNFLGHGIIKNMIENETLYCYIKVYDGLNIQRI